MEAIYSYKVQRQIQESCGNLKSNPRKIGLFKCRIVEVCVLVASELIGWVCSWDRSVIGRQVLAQCSGRCRVSYVILFVPEEENKAKFRNVLFSVFHRAYSHIFTYIYIYSYIFTYIHIYSPTHAHFLNDTIKL